jgi:uncharacterized protein (UPF0261 family)
LADRRILVVGTYDTKNDELTYIAEVLRKQGGAVVTMDVSVLGEAAGPTDVSKHEVAAAADSSIVEAIAAQDENFAMQVMARGAAVLAARMFADARFDGVLILGGTMGTDLALDVCSALPLGVPKYIVSTVAFSPLIPAARLPADIQMILWAGGLYGLNSVCKASLSQAAGAVLGAARAVERPNRTRPLIGMTSFGKSFLSYMVQLKPALEARGFEVAVFHATGMGGRAFESLAAQGAFACVFDFATQEVGNHINFSAITAGEDRLTAAGLCGTPQIVAPGCYDLVDLVGWQPLPAQLEGLVAHAHNRLVTSVVLDVPRRIVVAQALAERLARAKGPSAFILPLGGCHALDRVGADLHDAAGIAAFAAEMRKVCPQQVVLHETQAHINDAAFCDLALQIFDDWCAKGLVARD